MECNVKFDLPVPSHDCRLLGSASVDVYPAAGDIKVPVSLFSLDRGITAAYRASLHGFLGCSLSGLFMTHWIVVEPSEMVTNGFPAAHSFR